jgi:hypothetical protein
MFGIDAGNCTHAIAARIRVGGRSPDRPVLAVGELIGWMATKPVSHNCSTALGRCPSLPKALATGVVERHVPLERVPSLVQ